MNGIDLESLLNNPAATQATTPTFTPSAKPTKATKAKKKTPTAEQKRVMLATKILTGNDPFRLNEATLLTQMSHEDVKNLLNAVGYNMGVVN